MLRIILLLLLLAPTVHANLATYILSQPSSATLRYIIAMLDIAPATQGRQLLDVSPLGSGKRLIDAIASLETDNPQDAARQESILGLLAREEGQDISDILGGDDGMQAVSNFISDLSRLSHRYGKGTRDHFFLYPMRWERPDAEGGLVIPKVPASATILDIAERMPHHDRHALADILMEHLPRLGFRKPSPQDMDGIPDEELALWVLLVRTSESGHRAWKNSADAAFALMASGRSDNFFHSSNTNYPIYRYLLIEDKPSRIYAMTSLFEDAAKARRDNAHQSIGTILSNVAEDNTQGLVSFGAASLRILGTPIRNLFRRNRQ